MADVKKAGSPQSKKKVRFVGGIAKAYVQSSFNNTIISITDEKGNTVCWASAGGRSAVPFNFRVPLRRDACPNAPEVRA